MEKNQKNMTSDNKAATHSKQNNEKGMMKDSRSTSQNTDVKLDSGSKSNDKKRNATGSK